MKYLRKIRLLLSAGFYEQISFWGDFFLEMILSVLSFLLSVVLYSYILFLAGNLGNWDIQNYGVLLFFAFFIKLFSQSFRNSLAYLISNYRQGNLEAILTRPITFSAISFFRWCQPAYFITAIVFAIVYFGFITNLNLTNIPLSIVYTLIGIIGTIFLDATLNLLNLIYQRELPVDYIQFQLGRLQILPFELFSKNVKAIAFGIPIILSAYVPAQILTQNRNDYGYILIIASILVIILYSFLLKKTKKVIKGFGG